MEEEMSLLDKGEAVFEQVVRSPMAGHPQTGVEASDRALGRIEQASQSALETACRRKHDLVAGMSTWKEGGRSKA